MIARRFIVLAFSTVSTIAFAQGTAGWARSPTVSPESSNNACTYLEDADAANYLEHLRTEPDVRVMNEYHVVSSGTDQQLEAATTVHRALIR